jgi:hypothetical protein
LDGTKTNGAKTHPGTEVLAATTTKETSTRTNGAKTHPETEVIPTAGTLVISTNSALESLLYG